MGESTLQFSDDKLDELTRALIEDADVDNSGTITFEELQAQLDKYPGVIENLTIRWDKTCSVTPTYWPTKWNIITVCHCNNCCQLQTYKSIHNSSSSTHLHSVHKTCWHNKCWNYHTHTHMHTHIFSRTYYISAANWLKPPKFSCRRTLNDFVPHWLKWRYMRNNLTWVIWVAVYFLINLFLFVEAAVRHRHGVSWE